MDILHWKYLFSLLLPGNLTILVFFLLSENSMELTRMFWHEFSVKPLKFWCFLWRCNDCIPFWIIIMTIFLAGRQSIRIPLVWCTNLPSVPGTGGVSKSSATKEQTLESQSVSQLWRLESPDCVTMLRANVSSGIIEGMKGQLQWHEILLSCWLVRLLCSMLKWESCQISASWECNLPCYGY